MVISAALIVCAAVFIGCGDSGRHGDGSLSPVGFPQKETENRPLSPENRPRVSQNRSPVSTVSSPDSFYTRLGSGEDVNILIVGDSIGNGGGSSDGEGFVGPLKAWIEEEYGVSCGITNVSMGGNSSYAGIVRVNILDDGIDYDLSIICFGENDGRKTLPGEYEAIVRSLLKKYEGISIISVLESSQKTYTKKIKAIQAIDEYYGIPTADTIAAYNDSSLSFDELNSDEKHPNDEGYKLYFEEIKKAVKETENRPLSPFSPLNPEALRFESFRFIPAEDFRKVDFLTVRAEVQSPVKGNPGFYHTLIPGGHSISVYADGKPVSEPFFDWPYDDTMEVMSGLEDCEAEISKELKLTFSSKEALEGFKGFILTDLDP